MYYNQELGLRIEFGPVRDDSVRRGGGALDQISPAPVHAVMDFYQGYLRLYTCYLSITPSSLKYYMIGVLFLRPMHPMNKE